MHIALIGKKYSGKDTVAKYLIENYGYTRLAFADPIKDICKNVFNMNEEQLNGSLKEEIDKFWNISPRQLMQFIGTEMFRDQLNKNIWIKILERKMNIILKNNPNAKIVITDLRFINEEEFVDKFNFLKIKILRDSSYNDNHESENNNLKYHCIIDNRKSIKNLYSNIEEIMIHQKKSYLSIYKKYFYVLLLKIIKFIFNIQINDNV